MSKAAEMAADWWTERLESGDREKFRATLLPLIEAELAAHGDCWLRCDYDPDGPLLIAVQASGHPECKGFLFSAKGILPYKHSLRVRPNELKPKEGYGNWTENIPVPPDEPLPGPEAHR